MAHSLLNDTIKFEIVGPNKKLEIDVPTNTCMIVGNEGLIECQQIKLAADCCWDTEK